MYLGKREKSSWLLLHLVTSACQVETPKAIVRGFHILPWERNMRLYLRPCLLLCSIFFISFESNSILWESVPPGSVIMLVIVIFARSVLYIGA